MQSQSFAFTFCMLSCIGELRVYILPISRSPIGSVCPDSWEATTSPPVQEQMRKPLGTRRAYYTLR